jgi:sulfate transport system substrate-binding protein
LITSNPKTSGAGRLAYLAAWGYALNANNKDEAKAKEYITALYKNVPVLDSGARGSTTTFVQRGIGDVLLAWENEAFLAIKEGQGEPVEMVVPSISVLAEPPVALLDKNAEANGTTEVAKSYLEYMYSPAGQKIAVKHYYRPSEPEYVGAEAMKQFPEVTLFSVKEVFGGWREAHDKHFKDGGVFDSIYVPQ